MRAAIDRIKHPLFDGLEHQWRENRPRPIPLPQTAFPFIALLVDSTSIEVYRPKGRFDKAKTYWDGHNKIYAFKKEVFSYSCTFLFLFLYIYLGCCYGTQSPLCSFSQKAEVGSAHDYSYHKQVCPAYESYVEKRPEEINAIHSDTANTKWAVLGM